MNAKLATALKIILPILLVAIAAFGARQLAASRPAPQTQRAEPPVPVVRSQSVEFVDEQLIVESQGTVAPRTESLLASEVAGRVVWVSPDFVSGGFFEADAPLLRVDAHDYQQALIGAEADVSASQLRLAQEEAEAELARLEWQQLGQGEAAELTLHVPQLANAHAAVRAAEANLEQAKRNLQRTELRAPYAGRVRSKNVDVGQYVRPGDELAVLYAIDYAEVRLPLPDDDLAFVDLPVVYRGEQAVRGPRVTLLAQFAGQSWQWHGRIVRTEGEIDPDSRMVNAIAQVQNPYQRGTGANIRRPPLAAGMYVQARIHGRVAEQVAVIPRAALLADGRVLVIDADDRLRFREVEILRATRDQVLVGQGLANGERVCVSNLDTVTDGMRVRVAARQAASDGAAPEPGR